MDGTGSHRLGILQPRQSQAINVSFHIVLPGCPPHGGTFFALTISFRGESSTDTWVHRVALNVAVTEVRRRARQPNFVPLEEWMYETIAEEIDKAPPDSSKPPSSSSLPNPLPPSWPSAATPPHVSVSAACGRDGGALSPSVLPPRAHSSWSLVPPPSAMATP